MKNNLSYQKHLWTQFQLVWLILAAFLITPVAPAQQWLKTTPEYRDYQKKIKAMTNLVQYGSLNVTWRDGGKSFDYALKGKQYRYDIESQGAKELTAAEKSAASPSSSVRRSTRPPQAERPERGRQYAWHLSPDGKLKALHQDRNLWLCDTNGSNKVAVTTDGSEPTRIKYGIANWVYGEELYQNTAIWWSSNSAKVAFYRFDESRLKDYYQTLDQVRIQNRLDVEPYMKVGTPNPVVDLMVYDLATKTTTKLDVRDGKPFNNDVLGHYIYGISWTADSKELIFHRTNRRQNIMELCAANPETGKCRVIVREEWLPSWTENLPVFRFLKDGKRFIWSSERTGWKNYYLYHLDGTLLATLTDHLFEVENIVRVDEEQGFLYYMAHDGDNPMKLQLHRVNLDGKNHRRMTDPTYYHSVDIAPDGQHFIDVAQTHNIPPFTRLVNAEGGVVTNLHFSDLTRFKKMGLKPVELLQFKAADGTTDLYGMLHYPSDFSRFKKYPLLVSVYAGPGTVGARETFSLPDRLTEYGFLVASFDSRSASGRGKKFLDAIYQKLGVVEIDDQAAGVKSLWNRSYVDKKRVGMFGTSYGGTVSATSILRYPEVFQAASANSAVTDYRNYDTIYAERYMYIPEENKAAFEAASIMNHATNLQGRLMIFYGTADNNVHPANSHQLIHALQRAGKSFEVQVGPDQGHTAVNRERMVEFFIQSLRRRLQ